VLHIDGFCLAPVPAGVKVELKLTSFPVLILFITCLQRSAATGNDRPSGFLFRLGKATCLVAQEVSMEYQRRWFSSGSRDLAGLHGVLEAAAMIVVFALPPLRLHFIPRR
jgi:hypothetical protein